MSLERVGGAAELESMGLGGTRLLPVFGVNEGEEVALEVSIEVFCDKRSLSISTVGALRLALLLLSREGLLDPSALFVWEVEGRFQRKVESQQTFSPLLHAHAWSWGLARAQCEGFRRVIVRFSRSEWVAIIVVVGQGLARSGSVRAGRTKT